MNFAISINSRITMHTSISGLCMPMTSTCASSTMQYKNSSGDEIANVNFLRRYRTRTSKYQKRKPISFNQLDDNSAGTANKVLNV